MSEFCCTLLNHWSFTGIGWDLGIESCAQSIADSLEMADRDPAVKTGINLDGPAYELVAELYPHLAARLRRYLDQGRVEIVGGTYGQPMGSMVSGESNLRQLVVGQQAVRAVLGRKVAVFLEEEEMSHPQIPQLLVEAGYRYASLAQCDTWGRHGAPVMEEPVVRWQGLDGTQIVTAPLTPLVFHPPAVTHDLDWLWSDEGQAALQRVGARRIPLVLKWTEFGWEKLTGKAINKFDPELFDRLSGRFTVRYVTVEEYLDRETRAGAAPLTTVRLTRDDFHKLLPWGIGGDQIRRRGREVEAALLAAERFEAVAHALGAGVDGEKRLAAAWRSLLCAQSHDVSLCEYTRHQGAVPPAEPRMETHFQTWGANGYRLMDEAMQGAREVLGASLRALAGPVGNDAGSPALWVFNPAPAEGASVVASGVVELGEGGWTGVGLRDHAGNEVPCQVVGGESEGGRLGSVELIFPAPRLPAIGCAVYRLEQSAPGGGPATDLVVDEAGLSIRNDLVSVALDPVNGAIRSLRLAAGRETVDPRRPFPTLHGRPNPDALPQRHASGFTDRYDTGRMEASFTWIEKGPVRARVRVTYPPVRGMRFEFTVGLAASSPEVEVLVRFFPDMPPLPGEGNINGWQFPLEVGEGYWLEFAPAFDPAKVLRDYPFGIEPCAGRVVEALTWLDLQAEDGGGLLVVHSGAQYFRRHEDGRIANLIVREWESHFTGEFGWPRVVDHRYVLVPHDGSLTHGGRVRAAARADLRPCCVSAPAPRVVPAPRSYLSADAEGAVVSALRRVGSEIELRLAECAGTPSSVRLRPAIPAATIRRTNALGENPGEARSLAGNARLELRPWEVLTCRIAR
jgi:Glycosyl hydrolases family 38 N-terminal domain